MKPPGRGTLPNLNEGFTSKTITVAVGLALILREKASLGQKQDTMKTDNKA